MVEGSEAVEKEMSISYRAAPRTSVLSPASSFYVDLEGQIAIPSLEQSVSSRTGHLDPVTQVQSTLQEPISIEHNEGGDRGPILAYTPPSYSVLISSLSIAQPPYRAYIPVPFPIPIPHTITNAIRGLARRQNRHSTENEHVTHSDGFIVRNVSAVVKQGEVMALIGGSGSGKTTLLHAIAARLGDLHVAEGSVSIIAAPTGAAFSAFGDRTGLNCRGMLGFVQQNDYLLPRLTVRETLRYAGKLRLPSYIDSKTRNRIVEQTIRELGLTDVADLTVGGDGHRGKGISGGEKRRLSIGCILVSLPSVLVLDEVTTGLDSYTAFQLLETLNRLAKLGRTIILSIHQPRSDAFPLFSKLLLLSHGSVVYSGRTSDCLAYFARLGYEPEIQTNPFDFLVDLSSTETGDLEIARKSRERLKGLFLRWRDEEKEHAGLDDPKHDINVVVMEQDIFEAARHGPQDIGVLNKMPGAWTQTCVLLSRAFKNMIRAYPELIGHFLQAVILGLVMGLSFFQLGINPQPNDIQSLKTLAFQVVPVYAYMSQVVWTYRWCNGLVVFEREREDSLYQPAAWVFAEFLACLPVNVLGPAIYSILMYFICSLRMDEVQQNLSIFVTDLVLVQLCFFAWSLLAASIGRTFARATLLGNALSVFFLLSPGYFIINVPGWIRWFRWLSPHFYSFRIIVISQFRNRTFACIGVSGPDLAQCSGENVLHGLRISPSDHLWHYYLAHTVFIASATLLSILYLMVWAPGSVRHARRVISPERRERNPPTDTNPPSLRARIDVTAEAVKLIHSRRILPSLRKVEIPILVRVSARFPAGELSVIMGPSGSGKSTFLRICAGKTLKGSLLSSFHTYGEIRFNGMSAHDREKISCAFVEQDDDHHLPALTVRETLRFTARLKLPSTMSEKDKFSRVEDVLNMLGLADCADGLVGGELLKGISGGEKRRLSLACEMINDPAVLIVDEPTSGLDAYTARSVVEALRNIARSGRTVIASLHQPRSDIFNMADNIMVMAKYGNVIYQGPREGLLPHLSLAGYQCPPLYNPADFCMDLVSVGSGFEMEQLENIARIKELINCWKTYEDKSADTRIHKQIGGEAAVSPEHITESVSVYSALPVILERTLRNTWRQSDLFWTRWIQAPFLAILFFIFFLRLTKGPAGAQDRIGLVAECTSIVAFVGFLNVVTIYPMEKNKFFHDFSTAGGRYSTGTFILAFSLFAVIPELISAIIFTLIMNLATGMQTNARIFFEFTIAIWVQLNFGESIGIVFSSFFDTMGLSVSLVSVFLSVAAQSSGIFSASIVKFLADLAWIFPVKYLPRILLINEMQGLVFDCSSDSILSGECTAASGEQVLALFGFHDEPWRLLLISLAITFAYRVAAWAVLAMRMRYVK